MLPHKFRSHVRWSSTEYLLFLSILTKSGKAKIYYFYHICFVLNQDIVQFDIPMCYTLLMQVVKGLHNLLEKPSANALLYLSISALLLYVLVQ